MNREDKVGIQLTIIFHLVVIIAMLLAGIGHEVLAEKVFVIDYSQPEKEEKEPEPEKEEPKVDREAISRKIDQMLAEARVSSVYRNVAVNTALKDDRHSAAEADQLMKDANRLSADLKAGFKSDIEEDAVNETVEHKQAPKEEEARPYSGPSVLSWTLDGRKASRLPIPAYRCYGAGVVTVVIVVDQQGKVVKSEINEAVSSADACLRTFALKAADRSRFNVDMSAPVRQVGEIVYSFVAQ